MNDEMIELARRAVACEGWRWMEGMKVQGVDENGCADDLICLFSCNRYFEFFSLSSGDCTGELGKDEILAKDILPDLSEPATLGCLLALVREVWSDPGITNRAFYIDGEYVWRIRGGHPHGSTFRRMAEKDYPTEAHALVAALEARSQD